MESGEWTGEAPTCSYVDCGVPAPIENGQIELQEILDNTRFFGLSSLKRKNFALQKSYITIFWNIANASIPFKP